jgi:hypothetical protein
VRTGLNAYPNYHHQHLALLHGKETHDVYLLIGAKSSSLLTVTIVPSSFQRVPRGVLAEFETARAIIFFFLFLTVSLLPFILFLLIYMAQFLIAQWDYAAEGEFELSFQQGDRIKLLEKHNDDW